MASIYRDNSRNGYRVAVCVRGVRRALWLGKITPSGAKIVAGHLDRLKLAAETNTPPAADALQWAAGADLRIRRQLSRWGLVAAIPVDTVPRTLGLFCDRYASDLAGAVSTRKRWANVRRHLVQHWLEQTPLSTITAGDAQRVARLLRQQFKPSHAAKLVGDFRQLFSAAIKYRLITENPFSDCNTRGQHDRSRETYIDSPTVDRLIAKADPYYAALIALARYAGLRVPSEPLAMHWHHVDWAAGTITIVSPKTGLRIVPMVPACRPHLERLFELATEGQQHVFNRARSSAATTWRDQLLTIAARAGQQPWPKLWQNLRASCRTDLESLVPDFVANAWLGHSSRTAARHYHRITPAHFAACGVISSECGVARGVTPPIATDSTRQSANKKTLETT